jgi:hypothetical protein
MKMSIFQSYLLGLAVVHLAWFYFFTTGQLLRPKRADERKAFSLVDLVTTSAAGMALVGFGLLFLGFTHFLTRQGIFVGFAVEGILFWWLRRENWLSWRFWRETLRKMLEGWTPAAASIYVVLLVVGVPSILPPSSGDAVTYHLAYAVDWANAGRIHVDPFLRFPFYANNFLLLYSGFFILNLGHYCHFLTWLCGLLTCLGTLAFFSRADVRLQSRNSRWKWLQPREFFVPLALGLSPTFLRYLNVGMVDVPIGLFVLVPLLCAYRGSIDRPLERELVVSGAFCAGMKLTLIAELPLFIASLLFTCARRVPRRTVVSLCLALIGLSLPWYLRNLIAAGDPVPPVFNALFKRPDPIYTPEDVWIYSRGLVAERNPLDVLLAPVRFFGDPTSSDFQQPGVSALVILTYAPVIFLLAQFWLRRRPSRLIFLSAALVYLVAPWLFSSAGRHSLHWYPVLAGWAGAMISRLSEQLETHWPSLRARLSTRLASGALSLAMICPTPGAAALNFYRSYYTGTLPLFTPRLQSKRQLKRRVHFYREGRAVIEALSPHHRDRRVLAFGRVTPAFYFRKAKIVSVGDWFGPARFADLINQVKEGDCRPYLEQFRISAVIIDPNMPAAEAAVHQKLQTQLKENGFLEYRCRRGSVPVYLKSDIQPSRRLIPVTGDLAPSVH